MLIKKYLIELILFFTYALFAMSWKVGDIFIAELGFSATQLATMTNAINIAKIIGSLIAAYVVLKIGNRKSFAYSTVLIILGVFLPFIDQFSTIFIIRFVLGLGGALVLVTISPIVAKVFTTEELPIVNGLNSVAFNVGLAMALSLNSVISANTTISIQIISGILAILLLGWIIVSQTIPSLKEQPNSVQTDVENYTIKDGFKDPFNWIFALSYSGLLGFYLISFTFMKAETVRFVIYAGVIGALVGTFNAKSFKDKLLLVRVSAVCQFFCSALFLFFYEHSMVQIIATLLGFFIFFPMPAYVTLAFTRKDVTPRKISVTFSIFWALSYFMSVIYIQLFAFLTDTSNSLTVPFSFILIVASSFVFGTNIFLKSDFFPENLFVKKTT